MVKKTTLRSNYKNISNKYKGLIYISPWMVGFILLTLYPFIASFVYSFTDYNIVAKPQFIGIKNYIHIFTNNKVFLKSLEVTFKYVFITVPAKLVFGLFIAMILNKKIKFVNLFRTLYYLPSILGGSVAISILWRFLFMREGLINKLLSYISVPAQDWLGSPDLALFTISILPVWEFGSAMVLFLAGLKQIPAELIDAAKVDGASKVRSFFKIILPMLTPIIFFNLVMSIINTFQSFTAPFVITGGDPLYSTYLYALLLYDNAFKYFRMGYASSLSWILFIIIMAFTLLIFRSSPYWIHYEDGGRYK